MGKQVQTWVFAGALALAALKPAAAQVGGPVTMPVGLQYISQYTGVLSTFGYQAPRVPVVWLVPQFVVYYQAPQPGATWTAPVQPAVTPVQAKLLVLGNDTAPADVRIPLGSTVTWVNAGRQPQSLVVQRGQGEPGRPVLGREWQIKPNDSLSLRFYRPGVYQYHTEADPERYAQIVVAE